MSPETTRSTSPFISHPCCSSSKPDLEAAHILNSVSHNLVPLNKYCDLPICDTPASHLDETPTPLTPAPNYLLPSHSPPELTELVGLTVATYNANGLGVTTKLPELLHACGESDVDIILLTETKIAEGQVDKTIYGPLFDAGYRSEWKGRHPDCEPGGGVAVLVKKSLPFKHITTTSVKIESVCIQIDTPRGSLIVATIYNPPKSSGGGDIADLDLLIQQLSSHNKPVIMGGDFNLDLMSSPVHLAVTDLFAAGDMSLATLRTPTFNCPSKTSCLDQIWSTLPSSHSGTLPSLSTCINKHIGVFASFEYCKLPNARVPDHIIVKGRKLYSINDEEFARQLADSFSSVPVSLPNDTATSLNDRISATFIEVLDKLAPIEDIKIKQRKVPKPPRILCQLAAKRNRLIRRQKRRPLTAAESTKFEELGRTIKAETKKFTYGYYHRRLQKAKGDLKKLWKLIKEFTAGPIGNDSSIPPIEPGVLNAEFASVGERIAGEMSDPNFSRQTKAPSFSFRSISPSDVINAASLTKSKNNTGPDGLPTRLFKITVPVMAIHLTALFNLSLSTGDVPKIWRAALVTPVFKSGDRAVCSNYRPISITSCSLKLMERCLAEQLKHHLRANFLTHCQFGFRPGMSCQCCLLKVVHDCKSALAERRCVGIFALDLSKAFDSLPVPGILQALASAGLDDNAINWFQSYLTGRSQQVRVGTSLSSSLPINFGVPQGSILGPMLFTIFVNEIPLQCMNSTPAMFADDTTLVISASNPLELKLKLEEDLARLGKWLKNNCLKVNAAKSNFMFISNHKQHQPPTITFDEASIDHADTVKILGFTLDHHLSMKAQIGISAKKARSGIYAVKRARRFVDRDSLLIMADGLVNSHLTFYDLLLLQGNQTDLNKLQVLQNQLARVITGRSARSIPIQTRVDLGWLDLADKRRVHVATHVRKCQLLPTAPVPLSDLIHPFNSVHTHRTRQATSNVLMAPSISLQSSKRSIAAQSAYEFNRFPTEIRTAESPHAARQAAYRFLLAEQTRYWNEEQHRRAIGHKLYLPRNAWTKPNNPFVYY